jgi:TolB-like protein/Flp pilus assembly protein TadD
MLPSSLQAIRQRKLVQWAIAYLAGAWIILQVADLLSGHFAWPAMFVRGLFFVLAVGFVAALVLAWYHGERGSQRVTGPELAMLAMLLFIAGILMAFAAPQPATSEADTRGSPHARDVFAAQPVLPPPVEHGSIAVLPFLDLSPARDSEYFSDGIAEEILDALARVEGLRVAARTSSFALRGKDIDVTEIGSRLRVQHVLEGSVRRVGQRARITAQLIDATTGYHVWSESWDRDSDDVLAVQEEIAQAIVAALRPELERGRLVRHTTTDPEALELYRQGRYYWHHSDKPGFGQRSREAFQRAIDRDPRFALAYAGLADLYTDSEPSLEYWPRSKAYAERALQLDPALAEAHAALAYVSFKYDWDWATAEAGFRKALELNPNDVVAITAFGSLLTAIGRLDEAIALHRRAQALDPEMAWVTCPAMAWPLMIAGRLDDAIRECETGARMDSGSAMVLGFLAHLYSLAGRHDDAVATLRQIPLSAREDRPSAFDAWIHVRAGRVDEARRTMNELREYAKQNFVPAVDFAVMYLALGEYDRALEALERAVEARSYSLVWLRVNPVYDPLRENPRFVALERKVGLR